MLFRSQILTFLFVVVAFGSVVAQDPAVTVQLPTFNFTTVDTTVMIPDGGSITLGGIDRVAEGSVDRGTPLLGKIPYVNRLFKNRGIGKETSNTRIRAHAKILILDELEEEVMDQAYQARAARGDRRTFDEMTNDYQAQVRLRQQEWDRRKFEYLSREAARSELQAPLTLGKPASEPREIASAPAAPRIDLDEIRRQTELAKKQRDAEAVGYFDKAKAAELAGRTGTARVYYNMAARRATGEFQSQIQARLAGLDN